MMVARTLVAVPARSERNIGELATNVTLITSLMQKGCDCKVPLTVPVHADPSARDSVHSYTLQLQNSHWLDVGVFDVAPRNVKGLRQGKGQESVPSPFPPLWGPAPGAHRADT